MTDPAPASSSLPPDDETSLIGEQTQSGRHRPSGPDDDPDWYKPRPGPRPPVPDLEPPPERPLFAPDDARVRSQAGRASVTTSWGATDWADQHPRQSWASGDRRDEEPRWPVGHDPREPAQEWDEPARHWLRLPLLIGLLALVAIVVAFLLAFQGSGSQPSGAPPASHTAAARVSPTGPGSA